MSYYHKYRQDLQRFKRNIFANALKCCVFLGCETKLPIKVELLESARLVVGKAPA